MIGASTGDIQLVLTHPFCMIELRLMIPLEPSANCICCAMVGTYPARPLPEVYAERYGSITAGDREG